MVFCLCFSWLVSLWKKSVYIMTSMWPKPHYISLNQTHHFATVLAVSIFSYAASHHANHTEHVPGVTESPKMFFCFLFFLGQHPSIWRVPGSGVELELQLPAYTTAIATWDLRLVCDPHHSSWRHWILNQLIKARDRTHVLMDTSWVCYHWATRNSSPRLLNILCGSYLIEQYEILNMQNITN